MIREMLDSDWKRIEEIYAQGIESGKATFNTSCPSFEEWDSSHFKKCRYVYEIEGRVVGWVALSPVSSREAYKGVGEVSIYVDNAFQHKGVGSGLLKHLVENASQNGFWSILSVIFEENIPSIEMTKKCGFRYIGYRERISKDKFGRWLNTVMLEKRLDGELL